MTQNSSIDPAHVGQVEVEDDQIDGLRLDIGIDGRAAIEGANDIVPIKRREQVEQSALGDPVIVNDQDIVLRHHAASPRRLDTISAISSRPCNPN